MGGRVMKFAALIVVGDGKGNIGYGVGKSGEVPEAIRKGEGAAKKNMRKVCLKGTTIPHEIVGEFGAGRVLMRPAAPGTGVIAGGAMRAVLESVGIRNVLAKSKGSSNPHNLVKATVAALLALRDARSVAQVRGVSLDTVFNGKFGKEMAKLKITQIKSRIGSSALQKKNLDAQGLRTPNQTVEHDD